MALEIRDRVKETCTGTNGDMTLTGAVSGFVGFDLDATLDGDTIYYALEDADGTKWEVGLGTLSADSTSIERTTILATQVSFTDTTRQTFSGGTHTIFATYPASKAVYLDASGNLSHTVALTTDTSGNYVATITGGTGITSTGATSGEGIAHSLSVDASQTQITAVGTIATGTWQGTQIATAYIADNSITLAKLAGGTDGQIITFDANGDPVAVGPGTDGQILTSTGAGSPPAFEDPASGASNITGLSDALVEDNSIYLGNDPSSTTSTAERNIAIGSTALDAVTTADDIIAIGYNTGTAITANTSSKNILIGSYAGENLTIGSDENVFIGYEAGHGLVDYHVGSVVIGYHAGYSATDDRANYGKNVHIGHQAGMEGNCQYSVHIGPQAGEYNSGNASIAIGDGALKGASDTPIDTFDTVAIGAGAGAAATGDQCVYLGHNAGASNTSNKMLFIGWDAPSSNESIIKADMDNKHVAVGVADSLAVSAGSPTFQVYTQDAADPAFYAKMAGSHSGNLIEIENNSGTDIFVVNSSGQVSTGTWQGTAIAQAYIANDAINGDKIADDAVDSEHYAAGSIDEEHLNATNTPTDNYILSYDDASGGFTWVAAGAGEANEYSFKTISVAGQDDVVADTTTDTLTLAAGSNVTITTTAGTDTVTIASTDTNTMGSGFTVSATTDTTATTITQGDDLMFTAGTGITCETTADGTVTISCTVTDTNTQLSQEQVEDFVGGMLGGTETLITVTYQDGTGDIDFVVDNDLSNYDNSSSGFITATLTEEQVEDFVGGMLGGTETGITVTYQDDTGDIDFVVSDTTVAGDSGSTAMTPGDTLTIAGGTNVTTAMSGDTLTITATDTNTMGSGFTVSATTDSNATTITQGDDLMFAAGTGITCETTADGTVTISCTVTDTNTTYTKASFDVDHLFTLVGASADTDEHLSTFTGSTIADNQTIKAALQALETAVETKGATAGSSSIVTVGTISSGTWQGTAIAHAYIGDDAIDGDNIADDSVNSEHYVDGSIDTAHIGDDQVTYAKIQNVSSTDRILGRDSAGAGVIEEITPANLRTMINVEDGATADQTKSDIDGLGITTVGTIDTGVWQGTAIATAYIADDAITGAKIALFDDSLAATTTHFLIADGTDYSSFALSGDVTCTNAGVVSIADDVISSAELADACTAVTSFTAPLIEGSTSVQTPLIEYTDGDDAITIHDGGSISMAKAVFHPIANAAAEPEDATVNIDLRNANYFDVELGANVTDIDFTYGKIGQRFMIRFEQDASSGPYTIAWDAVTMDFDGGGSAVAVTISWPGGTAPTMTATDDKADTYGFVVRAEGHMDGFIIGQNMPVNDN